MRAISEQCLVVGLLSGRPDTTRHSPAAVSISFTRCDSSTCGGRDLEKFFYKISTSVIFWDIKNLRGIICNVEKYLPLLSECRKLQETERTQTGSYL